MSGRPGPVDDRALPSSFDENHDFYNENGFQKIARKLKQEPLVPLGCLLTVMALTNALRAMRRGDHHEVNRMFRARVAAQGFTILAMVAGGVYYNAERHKERELWKLKREQEEEEKRQKWIRELEVRDEEDRLVRQALEQRRQRAKARAAAASPGAAAPANAAAGGSPEAGAAEDKPSGFAALKSLGGWFSGAPKESADAPSKPAETKPEAKAETRQQQPADSKPAEKK